MSLKIPLIEAEKYRKDIDGMRAIAVISVIIFHFGFLPSGFLGVDVFFVISGFLITNIIYQGILKGSFSISNFYLRRTRRIIPLVSFICIVALAIGVMVMLPDDLENLAQSVIATNFFSNNILAMVTTRNYWDIVNEFKPLMHTWSLGIEEQYYFLYPFIFMFLGGKRIKWIMPVLIALTIISIILFFSPFLDYYKFYFLPFRFFELSIGGITAILLQKKLLNHKFSIVLILLLVILMTFKMSFIPETVLLFVTIIVTTALLATANTESSVSRFLLENKMAVFIGKISFSLYMWHQLILAFGRYFVFQEMGLIDYCLVFVLTVLLSVFTYYFVETPFRTKTRVSTKTLLWSVGFAFVLTTGVSFYIYLNAGVIHDIPELDIEQEAISRNMHAKYNDRVFKMDKDFDQSDKVKVLVLGNSFARDWVNVLMESKYMDYIDISYKYNPESGVDITDRVEEADYVFHTPYSESGLEKMGVNPSESWCIGTKNFGINNGYYYNYNGEDYCDQRTPIDQNIYDIQLALKSKWGNQYLDFMGLVIDDALMVPVFTSDCKFISQDTRHFTEAGAAFFAELFERDPSFVFNKDGVIHSDKNITDGRSE